MSTGISKEGMIDEANNSPRDYFPLLLSKGDCEATDRDGMLEGSGDTVNNLITYVVYPFYLKSLTQMTHWRKQTNVWRKWAQNNCEEKERRSA